MLSDPRVHRDTGGNAGVHRTGRTELGDRPAIADRGLHVGGEPWPFLPEDEDTLLRQRIDLEMARTGEIVDSDSSDGGVVAPGHEVPDGGVVPHVLVSVGHHGASTVPTLLADDVYFGREEGVCRSNHGPDVQIVLPVLDGNVKRVTLWVEIGDDGFDRPVSVAVENIASVAFGQECRVEPIIVRPWLRVGADADTLVGQWICHATKSATLPFVASTNRSLGTSRT